MSSTVGVNRSKPIESGMPNSRFRAIGYFDLPTGR